MASFLLGPWMLHSQEECEELYVPETLSLCEGEVVEVDWTDEWLASTAGLYSLILNPNFPGQNVELGEQENWDVTEDDAGEWEWTIEALVPGPDWTCSGTLNVLINENPFDADGNCLCDVDMDGVCDPFEFPGCTDPEACNWAPVYTEEDGSCYYAQDGFDCNGFCLPVANDECGMAEPIGCSQIVTATTVCADTTESQYCDQYNIGQYFHGGLWYTIMGTGDTLRATMCFEDTEYDTYLSVYEGECGNLDCVAGNDDQDEVNFFVEPCYENFLASEVEWDSEEGVEYFLHVSGSNAVTPAVGGFDFVLVCDAVYVGGCLDSLACNYDPLANSDDGSCVSCELIATYCGEGTVWDSTLQECVTDLTFPTAPCGEGTVWDPVNEECIIAIPADLNYDGCVTVADLLELLTVHGTCPPIPQWPNSVGNSSLSDLNLADIKPCVIHGNDNVWSWMFNYPMNYYVPDTCDFIFVRGPSTWETGSANQMPISSHRLILPDSAEDGKVILALCEDEERLCPNLFQQYDGELIDVGVLPNGVGNNTYPSDRVVAFEFTNGIWGQTDLTPHQHLWGTED